MKVQVRFFAAARELVGTGQCELHLPAQATLAQLADELETQYPGLTGLVQRYAVNRQFATGGTLLNEGDEVACIPPVGGG